MNFYTNFLSLCNAAGKSPSRVVLDIGLKKSAVTRWKAGGNPTDASAKKIADYFGVSVDDLLSENENKPAPQMGSELNIKELVNSMSREQLLDFIVEARIRLLDME